MSNPRVSVLLPVYNGEKYLAGAIDSLLGQTLSDFELLVLDDGSTDASRAIAESYKDQRIRCLVNEENRGVAKTLNHGIRQSRGIYIARMDSDDESLPERLEKQIRFLEQHPKIAIVGSGALSMESGRPTFPVPEEHADIHANLLFNCSFLHPTVCWRKEEFAVKNLYYEETPTAEDYDLWERVAQVVRMANLKENLLKYRNDPEVKLTRYVQQQKEGGRRVRERFLQRLGLEPTSREREIHHAIAYDNLPQPAIPMAEVDLWLTRIIQANDKVQLLGSTSLKSRLHQQRYYHFRRNRPEFSLRDFFSARGGLGRIPLRYTIRMLPRLTQ